MLSTGEIDILIGTSHVDEGVDIKSLDVCVLACGAAVVFPVHAFRAWRYLLVSPYVVVAGSGVVAAAAWVSEIQEDINACIKRIQEKLVS